MLGSDAGIVDCVSSKVVVVALEVVKRLIIGSDGGATNVKAPSTRGMRRMDFVACLC